MKKVILGLMALCMVSAMANAQMMGMDFDDSKMKVTVLKPGSEPKYQLKQDYPAGKYKMTMDMNIKQTMVNADTAPIPMNVGMKFVILADISDYDKDGVKTLKMSYEEVEMITPMGSGKAVKGGKKTEPAKDAKAEEKKDATADNEEAADEPATKPAANMMQLQAEQLVAIEGIVIKMDKTGKIVKIEGAEKMPGGQAEMISNLIKDVSTSQKYPSIGVGGSFDVSAEAEMPMMGNMVINTVTTLADVKKTDAATIGTLKSDINMSMKPVKKEEPKDAAKKDDAAKGKDADKADKAAKDADEDEDAEESEGITAEKIDMQMTAKGSFTTTIDLNTGLATESTGSMTNDMNMQAGPNGAMKMHQIIEMKMTTVPVK